MLVHEVITQSGIHVRPQAYSSRSIIEYVYASTISTGSLFSASLFPCAFTLFAACILQSKIILEARTHRPCSAEVEVLTYLQGSWKLHTCFIKWQRKLKIHGFLAFDRHGVEDSLQLYVIGLKMKGRKSSVYLWDHPEPSHNDILPPCGLYVQYPHMIMYFAWILLQILTSRTHLLSRVSHKAQCPRPCFISTTCLGVWRCSKPVWGTLIVPGVIYRSLTLQCQSHGTCWCHAKRTNQRRFLRA